MLSILFKAAIISIMIVFVAGSLASKAHACDMSEAVYPETVEAPTILSAGAL